MYLVDFRKKALDNLVEIYPEKEANKLINILLEERVGLKSYSHILEPQYKLGKEVLFALEKDLFRLYNKEPLQYVLGYSYFCGRKYTVNDSVLIPRPETELLCYKVIDLAKGIKKRIKILDLCSGSGCIAWTLALEIKDSEVYAIDISEKAVEVAKNQFKSEKHPLFLKQDIFSLKEKIEPLQEKSIDILISNPPYILEEEKVEMSANVIDYEPHIALFTPDSQPLLFYKEVASLAKTLLNKEGFIALEINDRFAEETKNLFISQGFKKTAIHKDQFDKPRYLIVNQ